MFRKVVLTSTVLLAIALCLSGAEIPALLHPAMKWGDTSRRGVPFSKDPSVIYYGNRYLLYYSMQPFGDGRPNDGWAIGIAASTDLIHWSKAGEILPEQNYERSGLVNGRAILLNGKIHLFYNTYGNGPRDALCHAVSIDGIHFARDSTNPILRAKGNWNNGRAIDCDVVDFKGKLWLYFATRDPKGKVQMLVAATAKRNSDFGREAWKQVDLDGPVLKPELPWETQCIEAPSLVARGKFLYLFYGGGYNNDPQQIGCAMSKDGLHWRRLFQQPLVPNGAPGTWNASESGHPGYFADNDGHEYLFFQANNDSGHTWYLSSVRLNWKKGIPYVY